MQTNESKQPQMASEDLEDVEFVGNYSSNMDDILGEGPDNNSNENNNDEEMFVYEGLDAEPAGAYKDQLRDVLGVDLEDDELEQSQYNTAFPTEAAESPSIPPRIITSEDMPMSTHSEQGSPPIHLSPLIDRSPQLSPAGTPLKLPRPYLHPSVSRLRSYPAQPSSPTNNTNTGQNAVTSSPSPSYFSELSGQSSLADLAQLGVSSGDNGDDERGEEHEAFRWTRLRQIENTVGLHTTPNPNMVKGAEETGLPTCMAVNGLICLGTSTGRVLVFNFKQTLQCVCGNDTIVKAAGAVTAVALSHDHTFVASGHASGYIVLYDLKRPSNPVRTVLPTTLSKVRTGRKEGHISGSRIVNIGFIASRHTALSSADDHGLAFYHSLGKVLFVEASDTLRILGKYPDEESVAGQKPLPTLANKQHPRRRQQSANAILALSPLPLGASHHATDQYQVIAVLTPVKLVVVGLKPTPKTWYRRHRGTSEGGAASNVRWKGCLAWCSATSDTPVHHGNGKTPTSAEVDPLLAYSWADSIHILRVTTSTIKKTVQNPRNGDVREVQDSILDFATQGSWRASGLVIGIQWLNYNQLLVVTPTTLEVYDVDRQQMLERSGFNAAALITTRLTHERNSHFEYAGNVGDVAHSIRVHKSKMFLLGQDFLQVGTMLTWADRILRHVENGDFLAAIELARTYYTGEALGNRNGLPTDLPQLQAEVGRKISDLMTASARYAFSEDRLTDTSHQGGDGRGVDRTSLFEGLVSTCARACITLEDYDFLFEELYQHYEDWGITSIYLHQLEGFIIGGSLSSVPARITQRLIAMLEDEMATARVEEVIWHVDPLSIDINQVIRICERFYLYDALVYVYTKALQDYVAPIVKFIALIRAVQQYRKAQENGQSANYDDASIEPLLHHGYKIFAYLANVLSGLSHPGQDPLDTGEAEQARNNIYSFLFFGRSTSWPSDNTGKLVLTADIEGGPEPTYPYLRLLLNFDTEALLHTLDIAFEDAYFNGDEPHPMNRLIIVKILLDVLTSSDMSEDTQILINIFTARNVSRFFQDIKLSISEQQQILLNLASLGRDEDREDRQLAAEYLLSSYTPHQTRQLVELFEKAKFFRILRRWYRQERQWSALLSTYTQDLSLPASDMFLGVEQTLAGALKASKGRLPSDVEETLEVSLAVLLQSDAARTSAVVDKFAPHLHDAAVESPSLGSDRWRLQYLRCLLERPIDTTGPQSERLRMSQSLQYRLLDLQCRYEPALVKDTLEALPQESLDWSRAMSICEKRGVFDVVVWGCNEASGAQAALSKAETFQRQLTTQLVNAIRAEDGIPCTDLSTSLQKVTQAGLEVCINTTGRVEAEDMWFQFLNTQIQNIQNIATHSSAVPNQGLGSVVLSTLRSTFHESFAVLMTANALGLPPIFKRLVEAATKVPTIKSTAYTEFRTILSGLLDAYGSDEDNATITAHLVDRDLFDVMEEREIVRRSGWHSAHQQCVGCRALLVGSSGDAMTGKVVITRTGLMYHSACAPDS